ncbi:MAG: FAD-binding oxidoreductase [Devosiaceae bacterium]|nr:FAD-binding oxidoreductase [Devosiaceae bacterium]
MMKNTAQIKQALKDILDANSIIFAQEEMGAYLDEPRKRFHKKALAIVLPKNVSDVQKIVRFASEHELVLVPQGGNTGLVGGQVPLFGNEIIISLSRLNRVRKIDVAAGNIVVEAGMILQQLHELVTKDNMFFPLTIASKGSAQIGGVLATNAGGIHALSYGNARELCLGIEAVMADGSLYNGLKYLKKDNSGYDLKNLLIGSEGTLAIITAANLKLIKQPIENETALVALENVQQAYELFCIIKEKANSKLSAFEIIPRFGIDILLKHKVIEKELIKDNSPYYALVEISYFERGNNDILMGELEKAYEKEQISDGTIYAQSVAEREELWHLREAMSETQGLEGASIKHDVSVAPQKVPQLIAKGIRAVKEIDKDIRPCPFGHLGDGNIHFNFSQPEGADPEEFLAMSDKIHKAIYDIVIDLNGSISAEHGIGQLKTDLLKQVKDPVALNMMQAIKNALDPRNIMNRGKILR